MILVADMVQSLCPNVVADSAVARRTAEGFATVKQQGAGWTWEPHTVGLGQMLSKPTVPYISQRAAYEGLQRAINALLREGLKERRCAEIEKELMPSEWDKVTGK